MPDRDGPYDEDRRKPIWWYHTDHLGSSTYLTDNFGRPSHYYETLPFGEMMVEHNQSANVPSGVGYDNKYKFNGKELDDATQMYYYGARYYDPRISIFVSVDPLAEKFVGRSPYEYCFNNPINLIDPTGMGPEDLRITGSQSGAALGELQKAAGSDITLNMDSNGNVSYTQNTTGPLSAEATALTNVINDNSVQVNVTAENTFTTPNKELFIGGAFMGNTVNHDAILGNTVSAEQLINPAVLSTMSTDYNKPGADTLHEVTEAYQGGLISKSNGVSSPAGGKAGSVYPKAHKDATPQSGIVNQFIYDAQGNVLKPATNGAFPANATSVEYKTLNGTTILKIP